MREADNKDAIFFLSDLLGLESRQTFAACSRAWHELVDSSHKANDTRSSKNQPENNRHKSHDNKEKRYFCVVKKKMQKYCEL